MSPCEITTLIHIAVRSDDIERTPAVEDAIQGFINDKLIRNVADDEAERPAHGYELTGRGRAFMVAITQVHLPVEAWRLPGTLTVLC